MKKKPYSEGHLHEAMDRTSNIVEIIEHQLVQHRVFKKNKRYKKIISKVQSRLADLYQEIGAEYFGEVDDPNVCFSNDGPAAESTPAKESLRVVVVKPSADCIVPQLPQSCVVMDSGTIVIAKVSHEELRQLETNVDITVYPYTENV